MTRRILVLLLLIVPTLSRAQSIPYKLLNRVSIGGEGGWDYLAIDATNRVLYIAHATQVEAYYLDRDSLMAPIRNTEGVHGIAIANMQQHGFISCGKSNSVLEFNLLTRDTIQRIPVGTHPDAILYDLASRHVFVMNAGSNSITVLDAKTGQNVTTIALPGRPEFAASDERGGVFVNIEDKSKIVKINSHTNKIVATWNVAPGTEPSALAIDRGLNRLFIGCANKTMVIMNAVSGKVITTLPIGQGVDAIAFDQQSKLAFSANGEGNVTVVLEQFPDTFYIAQTLETERGARTVAIDPHTDDIYLVTAQFGPAPAATADKPKPRPSVLPGTFTLLKYGSEHPKEQ